MNGLIRRRSPSDSFLNEFSNMSKVFNDLMGWMEEDSYFNDFFKPDKRRQAAKPKLDVLENEKEYQVIADVAGLSKEDIKVQAQDNCLVITGGRSNGVKSEDSTKMIYSELSYREFKRVIPFQTDVEKEKITAQIKDGLMTVVIPKKTTETVKVIDVEITTA